MKISSKLYISTLISISVIVVLFIFISKTTNDIAEAQQKAETTELLVTQTINLAIVLNENLTFGYERTVHSLERLLGQLQTTAQKLSPEDANYILDLIDEVLQMVTRLNLETAQNNAPNEVTDQLSSHIRLLTQNILSRASTLSSQAHNNIKETNKSNYSTALKLVLAQIIFMLASSFLIIKGITKPLNKLIDDAGQIEHRSTRNLIYLGTARQINQQTEIGQLARAFNSMTVKLEDTIQSLLANRRQLQLALKSAKCGLWDWNITDDTVRFDDNYYLIAGHHPKEYPEHFSEWKNRVHPDDIDTAIAKIDQYRSGEIDHYSIEFRFKRKDGSWMWILSAGEFVEKAKDGTPVRMIGLHSDISARKQAEIERQELEEQLQQQIKMEAIGTMAGGIAHNFNNNLAIILGNLELSLKKTTVDSTIAENLNNAQKATLRSRDLIKQILSYSRENVHKKEPMDLSSLLDETDKMLQSTIPSSVKIHSLISKESEHIVINAEASRIQEIILNLCNNAVHAMQEKGDLSIKLQTVDVYSHIIPQGSACQPGNYVNLSITDTGCGMTKETQAKIFDPFFTTKEVNEGTGLGLSTVRGIVEQHDGFIKVISSPGKGSTFSLYFPLISAPIIEYKKSPPILPTGHERIMFVDDEEMLASLGSQLLTDFGYQVTSMTDSTEALELFEQDPHQFDLIITDQTMPFLSGKELIKQILAIRADIPTILSTGYSNSISEEEANNIGIRAFCLKPMNLTETVQTVRNVLDEVKPGNLSQKGYSG